MAHPSTEIRNALHGVLTSILGLPSNLHRERAIVDLEDNLPVMNVSLGDTDMTIATESPREERRNVEARIAVKAKAQTGQAAMEEVEGYADLIERGMLAQENLGLDYVERVTYLGLSPERDGEGSRVFGALVLRFSVTYIWDYPELAGTPWGTADGGIDHSGDGEIDTPLRISRIFAP